MTWLLTVLAVLYVPAFAAALAVAAAVGVVAVARRVAADGPLPGHDDEETR